MPTGTSEGAVQIGEWIANPSLDTISKGTETHKLEPRTMRLLMCLANSAGEVVSVERLLNEVWAGVIVGSASVYQAISQLRKLLGDVDPDPTYIATVPRKGYRLIADVRRVAPPGSSSEVAPPAEAIVAEGSAAIPVAAPKSRLMPIFLIGLLLIMVIAASLWFWKKLPPNVASPADANSIVVLPFVDMTAEKADQSFCDGLTEELSNWLAQIPTLRVVARTSAFAFRGQDQDVRKIGKALDTNHILEGSMRRSGDHMRITVQLIDARNGYHLWSENFDRPVEDAIKLQEDISRSVADTLRVRLTAESERQLAARRSDNPQAYQLYLLARYYAQQLSKESTDRAIDLFEKVLVAEPNFAPVYTELAYARMNQGFFREIPIAQVAEQMEPLIASAMHLDNRMSDAYAVRGALRLLQSRTSEGVDDLQSAISLNPNNMGAFAELGRMRLFNGQPREALKFYRHAAELDPLNFTLQQQLCTVLQDMAEYDPAKAACARARVLKPEIASVVDGQVWLAESQGRVDEALRWNAESLGLPPRDDFELYWTRSTLFLSLGLAAPARKAVELGRAVTKDDVNPDSAMVRVVYREGGDESLRHHLTSSRIEQSARAAVLFEAAYARMLLGEAQAVKQLIDRALIAADREPGYADAPWYARAATPIGDAYRIDLAVAEIALGDQANAQRELGTVLAMLNTMIAAGVERHGTYELRARVYALRGRGDEAMRDLNQAAKLGWRRAWWALHEPYFATLRPRADFRALLAGVNQSNDKLTENIQAGN
jgi:TolB-like protein/DNA-binding winged helix-turn-helix (wHTH) protein/tetratricopeptide (TPR) repeat protein